LAVTAALLICPQALFAWSANGHRAVAMIAWSRLSSDTQGKVQVVLDTLDTNVQLADIAVCADQIRGEGGASASASDVAAARDAEEMGYVTGVCRKFAMNPKSEPWHFIDIPVTASPHGAADMQPYCPNANCVVGQINADLQALRQNPQNATALMFLVHFVGDEHQPLHCATEIVNGVDDRGGNGKTVSWSKDSKTKLNLHALWDHLIGPTDNVNDPAALSAELEQALPADVASWTDGDFVSQAALESFGIAQGRIYPDYHGAADAQCGSACSGSSLGASYSSVMRPIVNMRLEMAGVRLAALLEQVYGPDSQKSHASPSKPSALDLPKVPVAWP
jgi:hypothetical protein